MAVCCSRSWSTTWGIKRCMSSQWIAGLPWMKTTAKYSGTCWSAQCNPWVRAAQAKSYILSRFHFERHLQDWRGFESIPGVSGRMPFTHQSNHQYIYFKKMYLSEMRINLFLLSITSSTALVFRLGFYMTVSVSLWLWLFKQFWYFSLVNQCHIILLVNIKQFCWLTVLARNDLLSNLLL